MKTIGENGEQILTVEDFQKTGEMMKEFYSIETEDELKLKNKNENEATRKSVEQVKESSRKEIEELDKKIIENKSNYEELSHAHEKLIQTKEELERLGIAKGSTEDVEKRIIRRMRAIKGNNTRWTNKQKNLNEIIQRKEEELQQKIKENEENLQKQIQKNAEKQKGFMTLDRLMTISVEMMRIENEIEKEQKLLQKRKEELESKERFTQNKKEMVKKVKNSKKIGKIYENANVEIEKTKKEVEDLEKNIEELKNLHKKYYEFKAKMNRINIKDNLEKKQELEKDGEETQNKWTEKISTDKNEKIVSKVENTEKEKIEEEEIISTEKRGEPVFGNKITRVSDPVRYHENKPIKITLGNTGSILYNGKEYEISTKTIREGLELTNKLKNGELSSKEVQEKLGTREIITNQLSENTFDRGTPIDFSVVLSIKELDIAQEEKENLINGYIINAVKSQAGEKINAGQKIEFKENGYNTYLRENINVTYDMKNLSKVPFFKTLFARNPLQNNLSGEEKEYFAKLANEATRYGLGKTVGQYKETFTNKILNIFRRNQKLLPSSNKMHSVNMENKYTMRNSMEPEFELAKYYNENLYGKINESEEEYDKAIKEAAKSLRKDKKFQEATELVELAKRTKVQHDIQKLQRNDKLNVKVSQTIIDRTNQIGKESGRTNNGVEENNSNREGFFEEK